MGETKKTETKSTKSEVTGLFGDKQTVEDTETKINGKKTKSGK